MPALPVDSRCTLGGLCFHAIRKGQVCQYATYRDTVDQSTVSWRMVRKCLDGKGEGGGLEGWGRCPLTFGLLWPVAAGTVPAAAVYMLLHTSRTRNEVGDTLSPA